MSQDLASNNFSTWIVKLYLELCAGLEAIGDADAGLATADRIRELCRELEDLLEGSEGDSDEGGSSFARRVRVVEEQIVGVREAIAVLKRSGMQKGREDTGCGR